ncbi:MAG: pilus motility taxis protein HmpF, partial [Microcystaceae cyanobacterium]
MLYLAEVKKQTKGFISGLKTELKLLACQHNDQTWSPVPGDEIIVCEEVTQLGEGALLMVALGNNRQIQGTPELAATELVRQLQKFSRLLEKSKDQRLEIEQWKQSLTYQSEELTRRQIELEARLEQLEQMEDEFQQLEPQRQELESAWQRLQEEQQRLETAKLGVLEGEQAQSLIGKETHFLREQLNLVWDTVKCQQTTLETYWQKQEQEKTQARQQQDTVEQQAESLKNRKQDLQLAHISLEGAKIQLQVQQTVLASKQELLGRINLNLQTLEELQETITRLATESGDIQLEHRVDIEALENMPLGELQESVSNLQADLGKLINFVNDQEEELTLQCQTVQELQDNLRSAQEYDRMTIEGELTEEQERKRMLDETLVGQRRNLRERQEILLQHLRVLQRRQGIGDIEERHQRINLEPLLLQLEEQQSNAQEERQRLETEIEHLQNSLPQ